MISDYERIQMVAQHWPCERRVVNRPNVLSLVNEADCAGDIQKVSEVDIKDLCAFDTKVFGYDREGFLQQLFEVSYVLVALNVTGMKLSAMQLLKVLCQPNSGYKVSPIFCESLEIAKLLLEKVSI